MISVLKEPHQLKQYLSGKELCLFLEYDGILVPIIDSPDQAVPNEEVRSLLKDLASLQSCHIYIISGRTVRNIKDMVALNGIGYVGNHGLEIDNERMIIKGPYFEGTKKAFLDLKKKINKVIDVFPGSYLEDKGITLSIHYRLVGPGQQVDFCQQVQEIFKPYSFRGDVVVDYGKKAVDIKPPLDWDKGQTVLWILDEFRQKEHHQLAAVFIGDDQGEENVFRSLKGKVMIVKVGREKTIADYFVPEQRKVTDVLRLIRDYKKKWVLRLLSGG